MIHNRIIWGRLGSLGETFKIKRKGEMVEPKCFSKQLEGHKVALSLSGKGASLSVEDVALGSGLTQNFPKLSEKALGQYQRNLSVSIVELVQFLKYFN